MVEARFDEPAQVEVADGVTRVADGVTRVTARNGDTGITHTRCSNKYWDGDTGKELQE